MDIGVYARPEQAVMSCLARGFERHGHRVHWRRPSVFTDAQIENFDFVVPFGARSGLTVLESYGLRDVPGFLVELPWLLRSTHWAVWHWKLNGLPMRQFPPDRFLGFGLKISPARSGGRILLCGQKSGDAQHQMNRDALVMWAHMTVNVLRSMTDRPILWRPHPGEVYGLVGVESSDPQVPIERAVLQDIGLVVTYNSTAGVTALLQGVPVVCDLSCAYAEMAMTSTTEAVLAPHIPDEAERLRFFSRVAYSQWTPEEMEHGDTAEFLIDCLEEVAA